MPNERETVRFLPNEPLRDSLRQLTSMSLPLPVHQRLGLLTDLAEVVAPTRAEIVAMLIADAKLDPEELERKVLSYRKKTVSDVLPQSADQDRDLGGAEVIRIPRPPRGRPRRR